MSLTPGSTYRFTAIVISAAGIRANSSADIFVDYGAVVASISGGSKMVVPIDKAVTLDGSGSRDEDVPLSDIVTLSNYPLTYAWSCIYATLDKYGSSCDNAVFYSSSGVQDVATDNRFLTLPSYRLSFNETYQVQLSCSSSTNDVNRTGIAITTIEVAAQGAPSVCTTSLLGSTKFNVEDSQKIKLNGFISGSTSVTGTWSISPPPLSTLTDVALLPLSKSISANAISTATNSVAGGYLMRFGVKGIHFIPGRTYSFRLTAVDQVDNTVSTYSEIEITANSPPETGAVDVIPSSGTALFTTFNVFAYDFSDDADDYPLYYR